jgi:hypothetical protein
MPSLPASTLTYCLSMGRDLGSLGNATIQYNIADSPVGVIPVTRVDPTLDALPDGYWSSASPHSPIVSSACQKVYLVNEMAGLPVGIQVRTTLS